MRRTLQTPSSVCCKHVGAEQLIQTNHLNSTSDFAQLVDVPLFFFFLSANLSSNPDSVCVRSLFLSSCFCRSELFPKRTASCCKHPEKEKIESFRKTLCQLWCSQSFRHVLAVSVYSSSIYRLFFLIASTAQSISTLSYGCSDIGHTAASAHFWSSFGTRRETKCYICWIPVC